MTALAALSHSLVASTAAPVVEATERAKRFVSLDVHNWQWITLVAIIVVLLLLDLFVFHREAHEVSTREAAIHSAGWISVGLLFTFVVHWWFSGQVQPDGTLVGWGAAGEYFSGYLIEKSLSVDNVFVWALLFTYFAVPRKYQHRVLFWGIFGALVMRAIFIFAGIAIIERFEWVLYIFGGFLLYTALKMLRSGGEQHVDPANNKFLKLVDRIVPSTDKLDGQKLFTKVNGKRLATPLFAVLVLVEATDVVFAVDSVPAVLAVSHEQFIVFSSNAFAILGLRALYFLLADMHNRFKYLQTGLAFILAFVGVKMIIAQWPLHYHMPTYISLPVIGLILTVSVVASLKATPDPDDHFPTQHDEPDAPAPDLSDTH